MEDGGSAREHALVMIPLLVGLAVALPPHPLPLGNTPDGTPWPRPTNLNNGSSALAFSKLTIVAVGAANSSALLHRAINRYMELITHHSALSPVAASQHPVHGTPTLTLTAPTADETLDVTTNVSYSLKVDAHGQAIGSAPSVFGLLHALESFSQLVEQAHPTSTSPLIIRGLPWSMADAPRFAHRAVLVDTSRHFLPLSILQQHVDAMSYSKLSVLHWHLTDFQAFPFWSLALPALAKGAWSESEKYSPQQVQALIAYAKDRGVRVMIEVDTPGHAASWGVGMPELLTDCPQTVQKLGNGFMNLDPTRNSTYAAVGAVLKELGQLATDTYFHLGGDEVRVQCWNESSRIRTFMAAQAFKTFEQVEAYYMGRLLQTAVAALGKQRTFVLFQEVFDNNVTLPANVVFDVWKRGGTTGNVPSIPREVAKVVKAGHGAIVANGNNGEWYLNDGWGNGADHGRWNPLWVDAYALDPLNGTDAILTPAEQRLVLGGEVSLWGEEIDGDNLLNRAWPRSAAFAEKLWSPRELTSSTAAIYDAAPRLARFVCRLKARGITAQPISPSSCLTQV